VLSYSKELLAGNSDWVIGYGWPITERTFGLLRNDTMDLYSSQRTKYC